MRPAPFCEEISEDCPASLEVHFINALVTSEGLLLKVAKIMLSKGPTPDCGFAVTVHENADDVGEGNGDGDGEGLGMRVGLGVGKSVTSKVGEGIGLGEGSITGDGDGPFHCFSCRQPNASKATPTINKATSLFPNFIFSSPLSKVFLKRSNRFFQE